MAILDAWGKALRLPLHEMIFGRGRSSDVDFYFKKGFYTAAMNADLDEMVRVIKAEAEDTTPFLKIKVNGEKKQVADILDRLDRCFPFEDERGKGFFDYFLFSNFFDKFLNFFFINFDKI